MLIAELMGPPRGQNVVLDTAESSCALRSCRSDRLRVSRIISQEQQEALAGGAGLRDGRGVASRRPPRGLPHGVPGAELHDVGRRLRRGLPPGRRAVGRCQVDGMPHEPQCGLAEQTTLLVNSIRLPGRVRGG